MAKFNGHKSYNAWNVKLWILNDSGLYYKMRYCLKVSVNKDSAADLFAHMLKGQKTPDGVAYTKTNVRLAMRFE